MTSIDPVLALIIDDLAALDLLGVNVQITVAIESTLVIGAPISEAEYFRHLGERYRQTVEPQVMNIRFHVGSTSREADQNWNEHRLKRMPGNREHGFGRYGGYVQHDTRQRVQERLGSISEYSPNEAEDQETKERLAGLLADDTSPARQYLHFKDVRIFSRPDAPPFEAPFWRIPLSQVTGWDLGEARASQA